MEEYLDIPEGNKKKIVDGFKFLELGNFTSLITSIKFTNWGDTILIDCVYNLPERLTYRIVFSGCYKINWSMNDSDLANEIEADVIDFQIKEDERGEYAYFYTDIFEILIYYKSINIEKSW